MRGNKNQGGKVPVRLGLFGKKNAIQKRQNIQGEDTPTRKKKIQLTIEDLVLRDGGGGSQKGGVFNDRVCKCG